MLPTYRFTCIPLDDRDPSSAGASFELRIVTSIQFPPGQLSPSLIRDAVSEHPLLSAAAGGRIQALIWPYQLWVNNGHAMNNGAATRAMLTFMNTRTTDVPLTASDVKRNLLDYLGASSSPVTSGEFKHDARFDLLTEDHFVDVTRTGDAVKDLSQSLQSASLSVMQEVAAEATTWAVASFATGDRDSSLPLERLSFGLAKWLNAGSQAALLDLFAQRDNDDGARRETLQGMSPSAAGLADDIRKIQRRLTTNERTCATVNNTERLTSTGGGQSQEVTGSDPNVAVHAALKSALLSEACGIVTIWQAVTPSALSPNIDYVIQLDLDSLTYDAAKISIEPSVPTVFRRDRHTHPSAFVDLGRDTTNEAYAYLNTSSGELRYRASSVNTEAAVVKQVILQANSSISEAAAEGQAMGEFNQTVDKRPPQIMTDSRYGLAEHETPGVTFSAPVTDLVTPNALRFETPEARKAALPCLFLEDLWVGYRLDIREASRPAFTSIHRQQQTITFSQSGKSVSGRTEDFIEREQPDDPGLEFSSSELVTFNGMSTGQAKDYLVVLGTQKTNIPQPDQPFTVTLNSYEKSERLAFGSRYEFRLRNVFLGGVSVVPDDPHATSLSKFYRQDFPFYRARALRAGEIIAQQADGDEAGRTVYLTAAHPRTSVTLLPTPIDLETARYHGLVFSSTTEETRHKGRRFISDLGKAFDMIPPSQLDYFYDPDVFGVVIRGIVMNGNEEDEPEELMFVDGAYSRLTKHAILKPVTEYYGKQGEWEMFRPIFIVFRATSEREASAIRRCGLWRGCRCVEVAVSPAAEIHLSIVPVFDPRLLQRTASAVASSFQLLQTAKRPAIQQQSIMPAIAEQVVKVVHAVERPRRAPLLICVDPRIRPAARSPKADIPAARRELDSEYAEVVGRIEIDAASTKEVRLEATWSDVADDSRQERYVLQAGKASSTPRGIVFREFEPVPPTAAAFHNLFLQKTSRAKFSEFRVQPASRFGFIDQFSLQCSEDKVFLGQQPSGSMTSLANSVTTGDRLNVRDQRRKLLSVQAVAVSRFGDKFSAKGAALERRSEPVLVDVPSSLPMTAPNVSHIVPLRRTLARGTKAAGGSITTFALRVYLHRPWFQSGVGERLAVGCSTGGDPEPAATADIPKHITQWGEDPIERAGLETTKRLPKASDFVSVDEHVELSKDLYVGVADGANIPVLYRDSVLIPPQGAAGERRFVSLASYGVCFDVSQRLWYADIYVQGDFFGWCGLALYRHQPHSHREREVSGSAGWAYAAVLYGEPVAWVERAGRLFVTIGPVYDKNVTFEFDSLEYKHGVSRETSATPRTLRRLKSYSMGEAIYFEGVLPKKDFHWSLLKKRFDYALGSSSIRHLDE